MLHGFDMTRECIHAVSHNALSTLRRGQRRVQVGCSCENIIGPCVMSDRATQVSASHSRACCEITNLKIRTRLTARYEPEKRGESCKRDMSEPRITHCRVEGAEQQVREQEHVVDLRCGVLLQQSVSIHPPSHAHGQLNRVSRWNVVKTPHPTPQLYHVRSSKAMGRATLHRGRTPYVARDACRHPPEDERKKNVWVVLNQCTPQP